MSTLSIKNVPDAVVEGLRRRAASNHRSMQGELLALVCAAVTAGETDATSEEPEPARGGKTIEEIAAAHQARWKEPFTDTPLSTELIRHDRDGR